VLILRPRASDPAVLFVDTWVMSCRVFGRQLEFEAMNAAVEAAVSAGATALEGEYLPTAKNDVVRNLYSELGFLPAGDSAGTDGAAHWRLPLDLYRVRRTHIARRAQ